MKYLSFIIIFFINFCLFSQNNSPNQFPKDKRMEYKLFINAIVVSPLKEKNDTLQLLCKNDRIIEISKKINRSTNYQIIDLNLKYVYPSFIDLFSNYGITGEVLLAGTKPQYDTQKKGPYYWNQAIHPEFNSSHNFKTNATSAKNLRESGFGSVLSHWSDGIARGSATLVSLADKKENETIINSDAGAFFSFSKGVSTQEYPTSLMGAIALLRQVITDADWYDKTTSKETNLSLLALTKQLKKPLFFEANNKLSLIRASNLSKELGIKWIIKGNGDEYQNLDEIKNLKEKLLIPINFPNPLDLPDYLNHSSVSYEELKHWENAPLNPYLLNSNKIDFAITMSGCKDAKEFIANLRIAVKNGLSPKDALKSLTLSPANFLNNNDIGAIEKGKLANFIICSNDIFTNGQILENWIQGEKYEINDISADQYIGTYKLSNSPFESLIISKKEDKFIYNLKIDTSKILLKVKNEQFNRIISKFTYTKKDTLQNAEWLMDGFFKKDSLFVSFSKQDSVYFIKSLCNQSVTNSKTDSSKINFTTFTPIYPYVAFGLDSIPKAKETLFKNATIWTSEIDGVLKEHDLLIKNGSIIAIGKNIQAPNAIVIDATNKHITTGIIDEHSHICINGGVNEQSHNCTAEVRLQDVLNNEDINIYRQLAGGVTCAQILHGSANPIGGQSALIKLRWGFTANQLLVKDAIPFIKCALGENVKQSNWGDQFKIRFPQTRMGVEQSFVGIFTDALEYEKNWQNYKQYPLLNPLPRKDFKYETVLEILKSKRKITCHSYAQSEIAMLMKVATQFNFKINTFTHILEGYKVADKIKEHGASASSFSDWWGFKAEVRDAIPFNASILTKCGINTAINSDDPEMARHLNIEAAKAVKYGDLSEIEALNLITINPAKMLGVDSKMGSIKIGKDADIVVWSGNPLSVYSTVEYTFVDGKCLYNKKEDKIRFEKLVKEKNRILTKMMDSKNKGQKTDKPSGNKSHQHYHCDDLGIYNY